MKNYSTQLHGLKREIFAFCEKICAGLGKPKRKLVEDVVFGVAAAQSCLLSEIARGLGEEIALKKTIERLGRGLMNFDGIDTLRDNFAGLAKEHLSKTPTFPIDLSDLAKPYGKAFEGLADVCLREWIFSALTSSGANPARERNFLNRGRKEPG